MLTCVFVARQKKVSELCNGCNRNVFEYEHKTFN